MLPAERNILCNTYTHIIVLNVSFCTQTVSALTQMYLDQHNLSAAISLFMESLQRDVSLAQSEQLLIAVCQAMDKTKDTHNLLIVVKFVMDQGISVCT